MARRGLAEKAKAISRPSLRLRITPSSAFAPNADVSRRIVKKEIRARDWNNSFFITQIFLCVFTISYAVLDKSSI
jgi:hypothetical protein